MEPKTVVLTKHHFDFLSLIGKILGLAVLADAAYNMQDKAGSPSILLEPAAFNAIVRSGLEIITANADPAASGNTSMSGNTPVSGSTFPSGNTSAFGDVSASADHTVSDGHVD